MLSVESIDLYYGAAQALRSVSLKCAIGRVTCVLGRNGVGKSSLLAMLAKAPDFDVVVIALVGERGREVFRTIHARMPRVFRTRAECSAGTLACWLELWAEMDRAKQGREAA